MVLPPLVVFVLVLQITGLDGEKPEFVNEDEIREKLKFVSEDTPLNVVLVRANANGSDQQDIDFKMNGLAYFRIDTVNGDISMKTRWSLDTAPPMILLDISAAYSDSKEREKSTITVTIQLNKSEAIGGEKVNTTTVRTTTVGSNELKCPTFDKTYYVLSVNEDSPSGANVRGPRLKLTYHNLDDRFERISVDIKDSTRTFELDSFKKSTSARVYVRVIDTDKVDYESPRKTYDIELTGRDSRKPSCRNKTTVRIEVKDVNDEFPVFEAQEYRSKIPENAAEGTVVKKVQANDRDSGDAGTDGIRFSLVKETSLFQIDPVSGVVTVTRCGSYGQAPCLDYETKNFYNLTVNATDKRGSSSGNSRTVQLYVNITDVAER